MKRPGIGKRARFDVFKRDGFACKYCGAAPPEVLLELDHIIPVCEGGTNDEANLLTACFECNRGKAGISLSVIPKSLSERAAEIHEREQQVAAYREIVEKRIDRIENDAWLVADIIKPGCCESGINRDYFRGIKLFNDKLPIDFVLNAAELAAGRFPYSTRQCFLYFCGICWRKIREEYPEYRRDEINDESNNPNDLN